jgi:hypothetical protein
MRGVAMVEINKNTIWQSASFPHLMQGALAFSMKFNYIILNTKELENKTIKQSIIT